MEHRCTAGPIHRLSEPSMSKIESSRIDCFVKADPLIAKRKYDELRAADNIVGRTGAFQVLARGPRADPKDESDLRICLAGCRKPQTLEFAPIEMGRRG